MPELEQAVAEWGMPAVTVVTAGNPFVSFDRIGPLVAEELLGQLPEQTELVNMGTDSLALLDLMRGQDLLLVVDACLGGTEPGTISITEPVFAKGRVSGTTLHHVGPQEVLTMASLLYPEKVPRRCKLILVETGGLLPDEVPEAAARAAEIVRREIDECLCAKTRHKPLIEELASGR